MEIIIRTLLIIVFPALAILLARKYKIFEWIGPVVLCYISGMIMTNLDYNRFLQINPTPKPVIDETIEIIQLLSLSLSIPLLVFSLDFREWMRTAMTTVKSFLLAIVSVIIVTIAVYILLGDTIEFAPQISGMLIGVYTGGTPNMAVIGKMLKVEESVFVVLNTTGVLLGGLYFLFLISFGQRIMLLVLLPFRKDENGALESNSIYDADTKISIKDTLQVLKGLGLATIVFLGSILLSYLVKLFIDKYLPATSLKQPVHLPTLFMALTIFGIALSFIKPVQKMKATYETGEYLILVFCVALGNMIEIKTLLKFDSFSIMIYITIVMFGSIGLHILLGRIFKIDADTLIITSTAAIFGPPFVGPVAEALKNRSVIISGLTSGMVGLAFGTLIGYCLGLLLLALE